MLSLNNVEKSTVLKKQKRGERNILTLHRDGLTHTYVEIPVGCQNFFLKKSHFQQSTIWI